MNERARGHRHASDALINFMLKLCCQRDDGYSWSLTADEAAAAADASEAEETLAELPRLASPEMDAQPEMSVRPEGSMLQRFANSRFQPSILTNLPTCRWITKDGNHACFLSHMKAEAGSDARYLNDKLEHILQCPCFLDSSNLADLRSLADEVTDFQEAFHRR